VRRELFLFQFIPIVLSHQFRISVRQGVCDEAIQDVEHILIDLSGQDLFDKEVFAFLAGITGEVFPNPVY
jgi:hypothetical protein